LRQITGPICSMIHHLEKNSTRASWIFPLFMALLKDYDQWKKKPEVLRWFTLDTIDAVGEKIRMRWHRIGLNQRSTLVPLKNDIWLAAFVFDPYYTPNSLDCDNILGIDWVESVRGLLAKFYQARELENAVLEIYDLVLHKGRWGDEIESRKLTIKPPDDMTYSSEIAKVMWQQDQMIPVLSVWEVIGSKQFNLCADLAIRLSVLAVQSANVERVCKAHGVIHTKTRNRLVNKSVQMLLFCYVNLRLLRKETSMVAKFLLSAIHDELDEEVLDEGGLDAVEVESNDEDQEAEDSDGSINILD
jgi:hypothetical protein